MSEQLQIGEVAQLFDVTTKTIRHYEKLGLLSPDRAENDYRIYTPEDVLTIQRIRQLQTLGLSLKQIKKILHQEEDTQLWGHVLETLLRETQHEIEQLQTRQKRLQELLKEGVSEEIVLGPPLQSNTSADVYAYLAQYLPTSMQAQLHQEQTLFMVLSQLHGRSPDFQTAVLEQLAAGLPTLTHWQTTLTQLGLLPYGFMEGGPAPYMTFTHSRQPNSTANLAWAEMKR